jgi:hypothetical protein
MKSTGIRTATLLTRHITHFLRIRSEPYQSYSAQLIYNNDNINAMTLSGPYRPYHLNYNVITEIPHIILIAFTIQQRDVMSSDNISYT